MAFAWCVSVYLHDLLMSDGKESACNAVDLVQSLGQGDPLEKGMVTNSNSLTWNIPWAEEPGGLQSMTSKRVKRDND